MHQINQRQSPLVPRHYYQVALDFQRLSRKISEARHKSQPYGLIVVTNPARVLFDWDISFQHYIRPLVKIFHTLSTQVLAQSHSLQLLDTVQALVPLEQQVYSLLALRQMVTRHRFPNRWRRGQTLFLARIDKILTDLQEILRYFNTIVQQSAQPLLPMKTHVWNKEIACTEQTQAFIDWCQKMGCFISYRFSSRQVIRRIAKYFLQDVGRLNRPEIRSSWCNS